MKPLFQTIVHASVVASLSLVVCAIGLAQDETEGIVRITKPRTAEVSNQQVRPASFGHLQGGGNCNQQAGCPTGDCRHRSPFRNDWRTADWNGDYNGANLHMRTQAHSLAMEQRWCDRCGHEPGMYYHDETGTAMIDYFRCKFKYFIPTGAGGAGVPMVGKYARVYPQDPYYFDQRDGQVWAAQGYGAPMAVPLAPVVGHTYNYGWGIPSSRLTPISHPAY
jgi:hypothetical protein